MRVATRASARETSGPAKAATREATVRVATRASARETSGPAKAATREATVRVATRASARAISGPVKAATRAVTVKAATRAVIVKAVIRANAKENTDPGTEHPAREASDAMGQEAQAAAIRVSARVTDPMEVVLLMTRTLNLISAADATTEGREETEAIEALLYQRLQLLPVQQRRRSSPAVKEEPSRLLKSKR